MLGKLFEPYVVHVLPHLLLCFGDGNQYVREVSPEAALGLPPAEAAPGCASRLPGLKGLKDPLLEPPCLYLDTGYWDGLL